MPSRSGTSPPQSRRSPPPRPYRLHGPHLVLACKTSLAARSRPPAFHCGRSLGLARRMDPATLVRQCHGLPLHGQWNRPARRPLAAMGTGSSAPLQNHRKASQSSFRIATKSASGPRENPSRVAGHAVVSGHWRRRSQQPRLRRDSSQRRRHQRGHQCRAPRHPEGFACRPQTDGAARTFRLPHRRHAAVAGRRDQQCGQHPRMGVARTQASRRCRGGGEAPDQTLPAR